MLPPTPIPLLPPSINAPVLMLVLRVPTAFAPPGSASPTRYKLPVLMLP